MWHSRTEGWYGETSDYFHKSMVSSFSWGTHLVHGLNFSSISKNTTERSCPNHIWRPSVELWKVRDFTLKYVRVEGCVWKNSKIEEQTPPYNLSTCTTWFQHYIVPIKNKELKSSFISKRWRGNLRTRLESLLCRTLWRDLAPISTSGKDEMAS